VETPTSGDPNKIKNFLILSIRKGKEWGEVRGGDLARQFSFCEYSENMSPYLKMGKTSMEKGCNKSWPFYYLSSEEQKWEEEGS